MKSADPITPTEDILNDFMFSDEGMPLDASDMQADFEHGQWWLTHKPTGAQWSVNDEADGFCFERVSDGDLDDFLAEQDECQHPNAVLSDDDDPETWYCPDCSETFIHNG